MPTLTGAKITTLDALNIMASYIGIPPLVNLAEITTEPDYKIAQQIFNEVIQTVLSQGLPCNTDFNYPLDVVDPVTGYTIIPDGALICDVLHPDYTERDGFVYSRRTRDFTTDVSQLAFIVWYQEYDTLPELVKRYIITVASRAFVARVKGDATLTQLTIPDELRTKQEFQRYVFRMGDYTMLHGLDTQFIANRNQYYRRW